MRALKVVKKLRFMVNDGLKTSTSTINNYNGGKLGNRCGLNALFNGCRLFGLCLWDTGFGCLNF